MLSVTFRTTGRAQFVPGFAFGETGSTQFEAIPALSTPRAGFARCKLLARRTLYVR
jgi:hypothetical protein